MKSIEEPEVFYPPSRHEWRAWLEENHLKAKSVWVVYHNKATGRPTLTWSEAVDEALCFGWIDSKVISVGNGTTHQFFSRRKAKSTWSKINKDKIERLIKDGLMAPAGLEIIEIAKQNGSWSLLDEVEEMKSPPDLEEAFALFPGSKENFEAFSKSVKKFLLQWIVLAKRPETRQNRINEIAEKASRNEKPKPFGA